MVEQVEEVRPKPEILPFAELERLAQSKIHVFLRRPNDAVSRRVAVNRRIAWSAAGECRLGVGRVSIRIDPVGKTRSYAARAGSIAATEPRTERSGRRRAGQGISTASTRIKNGKGRARLQDNYTAGVPATQRSLGETAGAREEGQLIDSAGHEAVPPVEVGEAARGARVGLIVDPGKECHGSGGDIVNGFGPGIGALEIQSPAEMVSQGGLERAVVGIGVGREVLEIPGCNAQIGRTGGSVLRG